MSGGDNSRSNGGNLIRCLARTVNDFGKTLAGPAMVIDSGKTQVLERGLAYKLKELVLRGLR